jgi:prepilin-type N-terminal cleavage/methylation domain-containing protein
MTKKLFPNIIKRFRMSSRKRRNGGMTLTELLVSMIIAGIIIPVLLSFVVDLVQTNQQEFVQNETQREMQMAMDFIAADVRQAVYVYNNGELNGQAEPPGVSRRDNPVKNFLPPNWAARGYEPILAFWKPEAIPDNQIPAACPPGDSGQSCELLRLKRRAYSLVVYLQKKQEPFPAPSNSPWRGRARILRYQVLKYRNPSTLTITPGYVDPSEDLPDGRKTDFQNWPLNSGSGGATSLQTGALEDQSAVLVDFVDQPERPSNVPATAVTCPVSADPNDPGYSRIPADTGLFTNFFVCVKRLGIDSPVANQDVIVFLRGNPSGRGGQTSSKSLLTLKTQVVARGVEDKKPQ